MPPSEVPHATALSRFAAIAIPLGFCVHSSSLGLVNKHALSLIAEPMLMTLAQVTCAVVVCLLLRCCGAIRFGAIRASRSRHSCLQFAARWISISIFFVGSLWTSQGLIMRTNVECVIAARAFSGLLGYLSWSLGGPLVLPGVLLGALNSEQLALLWFGGL